jgi:hypothetical protein
MVLQLAREEFVGGSGEEVKTEAEKETPRGKTKVRHVGIDIWSDESSGASVGTQCQKRVDWIVCDECRDGCQKVETRDITWQVRGW